MTVNLLVGTEAEMLLKSPVFQQQWNDLYAICPWATPFQSSGFATTWYEVYRDTYKPVILTETIDGTLVGLLTLATTTDLKRLIVAGTPQAEYHAWLATIDRGDTFIEAALAMLRDSFPGLTLTFQYLPPLAPQQWLATGRLWAQRSLLSVRPRPLMKLGDGENLQKSLRKSSNKSRLNRLKRLGDVRFEQLHTAAELAAVLDEIIAYYDFRQGAVNDSTPFQNDPLKRQFYLALMRVQNLQHVTVLKVGDRVVSAHIGLIDRQQCILGTPAHSPFHAIHSPGKLQLLMLGVELAKQGLEVLDLTPGGDPYKERFATDHDEVYVLDIFLSRQTWQKQAAAWKLRSKSILKGLIVSTGIDLETIRASAAKLRRFNWRKNSGQNRDQPAYRVYSYTGDRIMTVDRAYLAKRDCLNDLLVFKPVDAGQTRQAFLSLCLKRLEAGEHVYTWTNQDGLVEYAWLIERLEKSVFGDLQQRYRLEPESALIYDYYVHPDNQQGGFDRVLLQQMVNDAISIDGAKQVYLTALADNLFQDAIETAGFTYISSSLA